MTTEEIKQYLMDNLSIEVRSESFTEAGGKYITINVSLYIGEDIICSSSTDQFLND